MFRCRVDDSPYDDDSPVDESWLSFDDG